MEITKRIIKKILLLFFGFLFLLIGMVGIIMPLLPTTPFVILAGICFSGSCKKLRDWLEKAPLFGHYIRHYREKTGISIWIKIKTLIFLWTGMIVSMVLAGMLLIYIILPIIGICVTIHIMLLKTAKHKSSENQDSLE